MPYFLKLAVALLVFKISLFSIARSEGQITTYFKNDSVNGLKISDAYETHNMGLIFARNDNFYQLDLGIVSPDMHQYKNEFRIANRSFGEIISLSAGKNNQTYKNINFSYYVKFKAAGEYGIDQMQDGMHKLLTLQPVNKVNDIVRMPEKVWYGIGGQTIFDLPDDFRLVDSLGVKAYLGNDRIELTPYGTYSKVYKKVKFIQEIGAKIIPFDDIVSAPPIGANHRAFIPYYELGIEYNFKSMDFFVRDRFSLPSIKSDNRVFGVLHAGISFQID